MAHRFRQDNLSDLLDTKLNQIDENKVKAQEVNKDLKETREKLFFMNVEHVSLKTQRFLKKKH